MMKRSFADILQGLEGDRARKVARKLPSWAAAGAEVPTALSLEQCSSEATARYKAGLVSRIVSGGVETIVDITGGLGVDSWAFSQAAKRVVYFERDGELAAAAERNFARLGTAGIEVRCETVTPDTDLPEADLIYADPARRSAAGRKVFLLEDCTPDILTLLPLLLRKAPAVLLKLSPMADLSMLSKRLGLVLREIHVVELDGEVKELLCLLRQDPAPEGPEIIIPRLDRCPSGPSVSHSGPPSHSGLDPESLRFRPQEERDATPQYATVRPDDTLFVPSPALLKAGAFNLPCARWGLQKLAPSTHLYLFPSLPGAKTPPSAPDNPISPLPGAKTSPCAPGGLPAEASAWFKTYGIREVLPFGNASFKELKRRYPRAEVTARNLPLSSEALQKKTGISPGGDAHIFACRIADGSALLLVCRPAASGA